MANTEIRLIIFFAAKDGQPLNSHQKEEDSTHESHQMVNTEIILIILFVAKVGALYSQQKQDHELTVAHIMNSLLPNSDSN